MEAFLMIQVSRVTPRSKRMVSCGLGLQVGAGKTPLDFTGR